MRFAKDLKTVANAKNEAAIVRKRHNCLHYWRKTGNRAAPQIVTITESTGQNHAVHIVGQSGFFVPNFDRRLTRAAGRSGAGGFISLSAVACAADRL